jgi:hypothetical protein
MTTPGELARKLAELEEVIKPGEIPNLSASSICLLFSLTF